MYDNSNVAMSHDMMVKRQEAARLQQTGSATAQPATHVAHVALQDANHQIVRSSNRLASILGRLTGNGMATAEPKPDGLGRPPFMEMLGQQQAMLREMDDLLDQLEHLL